MSLYMQTITMLDKTENFVISNDQNFNYVFPIQIGNGPFRLDENHPSETNMCQISDCDYKIMYTYHNLNFVLD